MAASDFVIPSIRQQKLTSRLNGTSVMAYGLAKFGKGIWTNERRAEQQPDRRHCR